MPVIVIPSSTGANTVFVNADTGRNVVLSGIGGQNSVILSGFKETPPHNSLVGLQGGSASQYYHLNSGQYFNLVTGQVIRPSDTGNFYPTSNPSGYITGLDLSSYSTVSFSTGISGYLQNQVTNLNNQTGSYYPRNNPSGYITGVDLSSYATIGFVTGISGYLQPQITNLNNQTGSYYPISNPSGFITGVDLSGYATIPYVTDVSGVLQAQITSGSQISVDTIHLYGKNNQGTTIYKGQPVYINGANGANPLIQLASNTGERTSSKTIGLLYQDLSVNQFGYIITEGLLEGFNTSAGAAGDPMWLGPSGSIIYGTGNKPYGNNHLVSLGIVLRSNNNNGKVYVKPQNGFEIEELHKVYAINPSNKDTLLYNSASGAWFARQINTGDVSGINNYVLNSATGAFYPASNPSGFITVEDSNAIIGFSIFL